MTKKSTVTQIHSDPLDFVLARLLRIVRVRRPELEALILRELRKHLDRIDKAGTDEIKQIAAFSLGFSGIDPSGMLAQAEEFVQQIETALDNQKTEEKTP
jgi:hypothetical protein